MTSGNSPEDKWDKPCTDIDVIVTGSGPLTEIVIPLLRRCGHPIHTDVASTAGPGNATVVLLLCHDVNDCCALADELHQSVPAAPLVVASAHLSTELEDQMGVREFAKLRRASSNGEEFHLLVHEVLKPAPDTTPRALKPRTTDHPPSSR